MGGLLRPSQHANPAHFIVPNTLSRVRTARITCSVFDRRIPSSAFVNVGDGVFVASPELCLLLEARTAAFASLVETGYELCGSYRLAASSDAGMMSRPTPPDVYVEIAIVPLSRSKPQRSRHGAESRPAYPAELRIAQGVAAIHTQQLSRTPRRIRIPATDVEPPCAHLGEGSGAERGRNMPLRPVLARRETRRRIRQSASPCRRGRAGEGLGPQNRVGVRGHPRHHRFERPAAHEVGDGQGRPRDGETAGNEMPLAGARLGTQADQAAITAARHHATGNAGRKNGTHDNNRPPKAPPPFAFSGKGLATFRDEAEIAR